MVCVSVDINMHILWKTVNIKMTMEMIIQKMYLCGQSTAVGDSSVVRKKVPDEHRDEMVRDQRLVILLTRRERERYESAALQHRYSGISELVRAATDKLLEELGTGGK